MYVECKNCGKQESYPADAKCSNDLMEALPDWDLDDVDFHICPDCIDEQRVKQALTHANNLVLTLPDYIESISELVDVNKIDVRVLNKALLFETQVKIVIEHLKKEG